MSATPKVKTLRDPSYLKWLRDQPCLFTGSYATEGESVIACHIGTGGKGIKSADNEAIPLLDVFHKMGHQKGEISMIREHAPDWLIRAAFRLYARAMYKQYKDDHG